MYPERPIDPPDHGTIEINMCARCANVESKTLRMYLVPLDGSEEPVCGECLTPDDCDELATRYYWQLRRNSKVEPVTEAEPDITWA